MPLRPPAGFISANYDPLKVADAPTIGTATGGDAQASVAFTAPSNTGGSAITAYYAVSNPDQVTGTAASSPVTVTGLTNGTAYTFQVWALNSYGPSPYSAASGSVTPAASVGLFFGGYSSGAAINVIQYITIPTTGNAVDFGDISIALYNTGACGSTTRSVVGGGYKTNGDQNAAIYYVTPSTLGNTSVFGNLIGVTAELSGLSNDTRGVFLGGTNNVIQYITIASTGNATDFGDLTDNLSRMASCASTTRGLVAGGLNNVNDPVNSITYITIATTGNAADFGDLPTANTREAGCSSSTRGIFAGGYDPQTNVINYVTIASTGNATDFGDLTVARGQLAGTSSTIRGVFAGGDNTNVIDYITIASTGNATDFGDLLQANVYLSATSNCHGGL